MSNLVFGGTSIQPSQVSYAAYTIPPNLVLFWPSTGTSTSSLVADNIDITTTDVGATVSMPDATQVSTGREVLFSNLGADAFSILDFDGGEIATVPAPNVDQNNWIRILLVDNSTQAGTWHVAQLGATTGAPQASALAGNGLVALTGTLNTNLPISNISASSYTFQVADRAKYFVYAGGQGIYTLPAANIFPNGWYVGIANRSADGQLTIESSSNIDGTTNLTLAIGQDCFIGSDGTKYTTLGLGTETFFLTSVNQIMINNNASITLTPQQATSQCQIVTGVQNQDTTIVFPNINGIYYLDNQTNVSAFSLNVMVTGGATTTNVPNGQRFIFVSSGTDMESYPTSLGGILFPDGSATNPGMAFEGAPSSGWFKATGASIGGAVNGVQVFTFDSTGFSILSGQGIYLDNNAGSNSVSFVADPVLASNAQYTWSVYPAASGYVLTSTTAGILSWVAPSFTNPMTTAGDIIVGAAAGAPTRLGIGSSGQVLSVSGGGAVVWATPAFTNPMTTAGDIIVGGAAGAPTRLAKGTTGQVLSISGGGAVVWASAAFTNPMTTQGDIIVGGAAGAPTRLAKGTANQVLSMDNTGTDQIWATNTPVGATYILQTPNGTLTASQALSALATGILKSTTTTGVVSTAVAGTDYIAPTPRLTDVAAYAVTKGDVSVANGTNLVQLAVGANGTVLTAASGQATGLQWVTPTLPQVIQGVLNTAYNTGALAVNTFVNITGLGAAITPSRTANKVLVTVLINVSVATLADVIVYLKVQRNGADIGVGVPLGVEIPCGFTAASAGSGNLSWSYNFLDSPASVAAQTYQVQAALSAAQTLYVNHAAEDDGTNAYSAAISTITLQEVLG